MKKPKARRGTSLVEVMIGFVLIGFLVLLVCGAVTSTYKTAAAMQKMTGLYYKGQQQIEDELDLLEKNVTKKYLYEKELASGSTEDPALRKKLEDLNAEIEEGREKLTVRLFGKDVTVYQFTRECEIENVGKFSLSAGSASGVRLERPVPVIGSASISMIGAGQSPAIYNAEGQILSTNVTYDDYNLEYRYAELYQWFVSSGDQHGVYYADGTPGPDEGQHGTVMPIYPDDFTLIPSERTSSMTVKSEYRGKFVFCLVTPLSVNGKMGASVMSNLVYVSDLPAGCDYRAVIDPSLMPLVYEESGKSRAAVVDSTAAASGSFILKSGSPFIDQKGETISENAGSATRFLRLETADAIRSGAGLTAKAGDKIFLVVRNRDVVRKNFLSAGAVSYGFGKNAYCSDPTYSGWVLMRVDVESASAGSAYTLTGRVDVAEMIVVSKTDAGKTEELTAYFKNKYAL